MSRLYEVLDKIADNEIALKTAKDAAIAAKNAAEISETNAATSAAASASSATEAEAYIDEAKQEVSDLIAAAIEEGTAVVIDPSLDIEGAAAESKAVGERLDEQTQQIASLQTNKADKATEDARYAKHETEIKFLMDAAKGQIAEVHTDNTEAYSKAVPTYTSAQAKFSDIKKLGGKSVVKNQLVQNGNFDSTAGWSAYDFPAYIAAHDNELEIKPNGYSVIALQTSINLQAGHKYLISFVARKTSDNITSITVRGNYATLKTYSNITTNKTNYSFIIDNTSDHDKFGFYIGVQAQTDSVLVSKVKVHDITLWFGAAVSITTPEDAYALGVPRTYIPYNAGEIISADCDAVVSEGKNLVSETSVTGIRINYDGNTTADPDYGISNPILVRPGDVLTKNTESDVYHRFGFYSDLIMTQSYISATTSNTVIVPEGAKYARICYRLDEANNVMVERGSTSTTFKPYMTPVQLNIPAGLREDYPLRSAPNVHDVYDLIAKTHTANVGSRAYQEGDENDATVITDGTTTLYPLTTPVVTDISDYLPGIDTYLPVEDGGSLTFHQTSTEFPVPNTEDFYYTLEATA